jgi:hypothetical protein
MSLQAYIHSFASLHPSGMYSPRGHCPWNADQHGPEDVQRSQVLDRPYPGFGKLSVADRLAFSVASLLLGAYGPLTGDGCGICLGNATGSLSVDLRYWESVIAGFPSPGFFAATLPSSPISDIAIYYGCKGPNRVIAGNKASGIHALVEALTMLRLKKAAEMLVVSLYALDPCDRGVRLLPSPGDPGNRAHAFLLSSNKQKGSPDARLSLHMSTGDCADRALPNKNPLDELIGMLMEKKYGRVDFAVEDTYGSLSIEKDS